MNLIFLVLRTAKCLVLIMVQVLSVMLLVPTIIELTLH